MSRRIKLILGFSIPLFIIHAWEEYSAGLLNLDPLLLWLTVHSIPVDIVYFSEQALLVMFLLWTIYKPRRWLLIFAGLLFVFETTHLIPAILQTSYYPGLITAILLLMLGFYYWKTLIQLKTKI